MADEKKNDLLTFCGLWYRQNAEFPKGMFAGNLNDYLQIRILANPKKTEGDKLPSHHVYLYRRTKDSEGNHGVDEDTRKRVGALWYNPPKDDKQEFWSGKMNDNVRLLIFSNKKKDGSPDTDKMPDAFLNLGTNQQEESRERATENPPF